MKNKLLVKELIEKFEMEVLTKDVELDREIKVYGLNRAGLELAGYFERGNNARRLILMSTKEYSYIMNFDEEERKKRYITLIGSGIPGIIITKKFKDDVIVKVAQEKNVPLLMSKSESTSELTQRLLEHMDDYFAPSVEIHGSLVNIFGKGVLLLGESGIGKSEITLELVKNNHLFVGDDRIVVKRKADRLFGKSHEILSNLVEVRGIGIIDIAKTHGHQIIMEETTIDLVLELSIFKKDGVDDSDRLGNEFGNYKLLDMKIPYIKIPVSSGRNTSNIVETAVAKLKLSQSGDYEHPANLMQKRINDFDAN